MPGRTGGSRSSPNTRRAACGRPIHPRPTLPPSPLPKRATAGRPTPFFQIPGLEPRRAPPAAGGPAGGSARPPLRLPDRAQDADSPQTDHADGDPQRGDPRQMGPQRQPDDQNDEADQIYAERGRHARSSCFPGDMSADRNEPVRGVLRLDSKPGPTSGAAVPEHVRDSPLEVLVAGHHEESVGETVQVADD